MKSMQLVLWSSLIVAALGQSASAACNIVNGVAYGDCSGVTVNTRKTPFEIIESHSSISGISEGAQVLRGGTLSVSGIADRVIVDEGGAATVYGIVSYLEVSGTVTVTGQVDHLRLVAGGHASIAGMVGAISGLGTVEFAAGAVLGGNPIASPRTLSLGY